MKILKALIKKEIGNYLNSPLGYVIVAPFLALSFFLFFGTSYVLGVANLRPFFELLPWFLIILAPALTMSLLTEEKLRKTYELLLAHPISYLQIVLAKFAGCILFFCLTLFLTLPLVLPIWLFSHPDWGLIFSQYLGALFLASVFVSAGLLASSFASSTVSSFILGVVFNFSLVLMGLDMVTLALPNPVAHLLSNLSPMSHVESVAKGLLNLSDLSYFSILTGLLILATVFNTSREKLAEDKKESRKLVKAFVLVLVCGIFLQLVLSKFPLRLDLTRDRLYSLSPASLKTIKRVDDILTIKIYASKNLPPAARIVLASTLDTLSDYKAQNSKINIERVFAEPDNEAGREAVSVGIEPLQFNTIGTSSYQLQQGYLGLSLRFRDKSEVLPIISETGSLEYNLTRRINKMLGINKLSLGIFSQASQIGNDFQLNNLRAKLATQYEVKTLPNVNREQLNGLSLLILGGLNSPLSGEAVKTLSEFASSGNKIFLLLDKVVPQPGQETATLQKTGLEEFLKSWGLTINEDLVIDPSLMETVQVNRGPQLFLVPYPFWLRALPQRGSVLSSGVSSVTLFWPSSINFENKEGLTSQVLLKTSSNGRALPATGPNFNIAPEKLNQLPIPEKSREIDLGYIVTDSKSKGQVALISDSEMVADAYLSPQNQALAYVLNLVDFLALGNDQIVPLKSGGSPYYVFTKPWQPAVAQWGLTAGLPLLVVLYGLVRLWRRRRGFARVYSD